MGSRERTLAEQATRAYTAKREKLYQLENPFANGIITTSGGALISYEPVDPSEFKDMASITGGRRLSQEDLNVTRVIDQMEPDEPEDYTRPTVTSLPPVAPARREIAGHGELTEIVEETETAVARLETYTSATEDFRSYNRGETVEDWRSDMSERNLPSFANPSPTRWTQWKKRFLDTAWVLGWNPRKQGTVLDDRIRHTAKRHTESFHINECNTVQQVEEVLRAFDAAFLAPQECTRRGSYAAKQQANDCIREELQESISAYHCRLGHVIDHAFPGHNKDARHFIEHFCKGGQGIHYANLVSTQKGKDIGDYVKTWNEALTWALLEEQGIEPRQLWDGQLLSSEPVNGLIDEMRKHRNRERVNSALLQELIHTKEGENLALRQELSENRRAMASPRTRSTPATLGDQVAQERSEWGTIPGNNPIHLDRTGRHPRPA